MQLRDTSGKIEGLHLIYGVNDEMLWNLYLTHFADKINELVNAVNSLRQRVEVGR